MFIDTQAPGASRSASAAERAASCSGCAQSEAERAAGADAAQVRPGDECESPGPEIIKSLSPQGQTPPSGRPRLVFRHQIWRNASVSQ